MQQKFHFTVVITVVTIALILMVNFEMDSFKSRADLQSDRRQRKENSVIISSRSSINDLEKELSFLNPDMYFCEDIFQKGRQNRSEFEHIWAELEKHDQIVETLKSELRAKNITKKRRCMEGYSYRYAEEGHIMAKLARWVKILHVCKRVEICCFIVARRYISFGVKWRMYELSCQHVLIWVFQNSP